MKKSLIIGVFINIFILQGIAEAASISTRVRILESKVYKQNKKIKQHSSSQRKLAKRVEKRLQEIDVLKVKVNKLIKKSKGKDNKLKEPSEGYSFP